MIKPQASVPLVLLMLLESFRVAHEDISKLLHGMKETKETSGAKLSASSVKQEEHIAKSAQMYFKLACDPAC